MPKIIKNINGLLVELVPGLGCNGCPFMESYRGGNKSCATLENDCLDVRNGGWRMIEDPTTIMELNEDPTTIMELNEDPIF